jgi:hypothetical protein
MGTSPAGDDHGRPLLLHPIPIQIEQFSCRIRKRIEIFDEGLEWVDSHLSIYPISNPIDPLNVSPSSLFDLFQKEW